MTEDGRGMDWWGGLESIMLGCECTDWGVCCIDC
jgi:hypothetical protein